jgi:formylglycine-generating enzyme
VADFTNHMVYIPKFTIADVSGVTFGGFGCDKYVCSQPNATPAEGSVDTIALNGGTGHSPTYGVPGSIPGISKPGVPVWDYINFPQAMIACCNKGKGWHLLTAHEWAALAFMAKKYGTMPHGGNANVDPPADVTYTTEIAMLDKHLHGENGAYHRPLPGTGPNTWAHNHLASGVFDLQGLVWQWVMGLFMQTDGHVEVLGSLDVTYTGSPYGRGTISGSGGATPTLTCDGAGVNWLKAWTADAFNGMSLYSAETGAFYVITDTTATTIILTNGDAPGDVATTFCVVKHVATDVTNGMTSGHKILTLRDSDADLKGYALPATANVTGAAAYGNDVYYFDKAAMRAALRGGYFGSEAGAGVFALNLASAPSNAGYSIGFRASKAL